MFEKDYDTSIRFLIAQWINHAADNKSKIIQILLLCKYIGKNGLNKTATNIVAIVEYIILFLMVPIKMNKEAAKMIIRRKV